MALSSGYFDTLTLLHGLVASSVREGIEQDEASRANTKILIQ